MNFCSSCGSKLVIRVPKGDHLKRFVCEHCKLIHYQNPKIVAGCLITHGDDILLCKRGIEPRKGMWTLPAGFLELGEATVDGAIRETKEETCADVGIEGLYTVFDLPYISQVYMFYRATLLNGAFKPGDETTEVRLFSESNLPWDLLAFRVVERTLKHFINDREVNRFPVHSEVLRRRTFPHSTAKK